DPTPPPWPIHMVQVLARSLLPGAGAQEFQLLQPQGIMSVSAGETLTLTCSVTANATEGAVKWFKGSGNGRHLVYADMGSFAWVTQAVRHRIYHCVKFRKNMTGPNEEFRAGAGTAVSVTSGPSLTAPLSPVSLTLMFRLLLPGLAGAGRFADVTP
uniref:Ig-like domain-containing protein n=1 Tax=Chelonoidis abingdonii TaxID=106734 RepID=A0A8C0IW03_CHEAB